MTTETPTSTSDDVPVVEIYDEASEITPERFDAATAPIFASAESVVRQKLFFPKFADGGPHLGTLYTKAWLAPFVEGVTDEWKGRVAGYWERLEIKYGVIWSKPFIDYDKKTGTILTGATPLVLIPGERYELQG